LNLRSQLFLGPFRPSGLRLEMLETVLISHEENSAYPLSDHYSTESQPFSRKSHDLYGKALYKSSKANWHGLIQRLSHETDLA